VLIEVWRSPRVPVGTCANTVSFLEPCGLPGAAPSLPSSLGPSLLSCTVSITHGCDRLSGQAGEMLLRQRLPGALAAVLSIAL
jgi:hypothetical protein